MITDVDEEVKHLIDNVNCNLFSIIDIEELPSYKTELNELFNLLKLRNDEKAFYSLVLNNKSYENISQETALMMQEFTNIKFPRKKKEGRYNMCKAIREIEQMNQKIGEENGIKKGMEMGADNALVEAIRNIMRNTKQSYEETCASMGISNIDMIRYKKMI